MLISEIFYSIQGEGELTGVPSVFIRTSGCNLRCRWCDTPYASWDPEGEDMSVDRILGEVKNHPATHVVLTGGEPMIARNIHDLAARLRQAGYHITIETAGTVAPGGIACDLASISPKFANSTPVESRIDPAWIKRHEETRHQPAILAGWVRDYPHQIKLVVSTETEADEALATLAVSLPGIPKWKIHLMPEGTSPETLAGRAAWLVDYCKTHGCRYCDRLHIRLFGNTKGT
ncbi:MAG: 7-carboxy-7-deazaguanine synthase QueE [Terrimicrobiaceae bacterium]